MSLLNKPGFSLIELLVSIAIIGILASMSVSLYDEYKEKAYYAETQTDVLNIYTALTSYGYENNQWLSSNNISGSTLYSQLGDYLNGNGLDPWDGVYYYDGCPEPCSMCTAGQGCESGSWNAAICSAGPNGSFQDFNGAPNDDDVCLYLNNQVKSWAY